MPKTNFRLKGKQKLDRKLANMARRVESVLEGELDDAAQEIRARSIAVVPEKTRKLLLSSGVARAKLARAVFYDTDYAAIVHEDFYQLGPLSANKAPTEDGPVGRKYLERPFNNIRARLVRKDFPRAILRAIRGRR